VALSAKEFALLETFMRRPGEVLSRFQLIEHAWDYEYENRSNIVRLLRAVPARQGRPPVRGRVDRDRARGGVPTAAGRRTLSRVPIRLRVTIAFTVAMAVVLVAAGFFVYFRLEARLDESINNGLRSRAGEVSALLAPRKGPWEERAGGP